MLGHYEIDRPLARRSDRRARGTLLGTILPKWVETAEAFGDVVGAPLFPEERAVLGQAVPKRRNEFATVRLCARTALSKLGVPAAPILPGPRGAPAWPAGAIGSMTHCDRYRAAAVALRPHGLTIGIDAEPHTPLPSGLLPDIAVDEELPALRRLAAAWPGVCFDRLLFTIKEAVYKAWFPLTHRFLDFDEAVVGIQAPPGVLSGQPGTFVARVLPAAGFPEFSGRWLIDAGIVATAIAIPASSSADLAA